MDVREARCFCGVCQLVVGVAEHGRRQAWGLGSCGADLQIGLDAVSAVCLIIRTN